MPHTLTFICSGINENILEEYDEEFDTIDDVCKRLKEIISNKSNIVIQKYPQFMLTNELTPMLVLTYYEPIPENAKSMLLCETRCNYDACGIEIDNDKLEIECESWSVDVLYEPPDDNDTIITPNNTKIDENFNITHLEEI